MERSGTAGEDPSEQIARLRAQVEALMQDKIGPAVTEAAGHAEAIAMEQAELLADKVRAQPLLAIGIAAGLGFLLGRALR